MTADIVRYEGTLEARANAWASMPEPDRRRLVMQAANERDEAMLWAVTEAHVAMYGRKSYDVSENTLKTYRYGLRQLLDHWQGVNLLRPSDDDARRVIGELVREKVSKGTVQVIVSGARQFYKALTWVGAVPNNPFERVTAPKDGTPAHEKRDAYTNDQLEELRSACEDPEDLVMLLLGAHAGLRASEMVALEWADVDNPQGQIVVCHGKGDKRRRVPISGGLRDALEQLREAGGAEGQVLPFGARRARQRLERLCGRAFGWIYQKQPDGEVRRVPRTHLPLHSLRHYCGTRTYRELGIRAAQTVLGHESIETTSRYAKVDQSELREAVGAWA